jgi:RNA polymerase sigma factor (sigma-70 family)
MCHGRPPASKSGIRRQETAGWKNGLESGIPERATRVTDLLLKWGRGDDAALERLIPLVHDELHQIARRCMAGEDKRHTLQATALINEAYLRLVDAKRVAWHDRTHFLAVAARVMRRILVDHARARHREKRGGGVTFVSLAAAGEEPDDARAGDVLARGADKRGGSAARVTFDDALTVAAEPRQDILRLDDALTALAAFDERKGRVVELRFFGGLSVEETAAALNVSTDTVGRDWQFAKVWLRREMRTPRSPRT